MPNFIVSCFFAFAAGYDSFREYIPNSHNIRKTQALGHLHKLGGGELNVFGKDFKLNG
jgi:hypothetical protein